MIAALLLLARPYLENLGLPHPSAAEILAATQETKSRAYELVKALCALLPDLVRPIGRPKKPSVGPPTSERSTELTREVLQFLYAHPGAATNTGGRRFYADAFRHRVLELREAYADLDLEAFARAVQIPLGTIDGWLREGVRPKFEPPSSDAPISEEASLHIQTIIAAWRGWRGAFETFVEHVRKNLRISEYSRSFIARILFEYNERIPRRRSGRSPDEEATRGTFKVYFPNAQWVGDGMEVPVVINGERFDFNLELDVDCFSAAIVGASIRDEEDSRAVVEAFEDGVATTGAHPLALLLDNRACNHTDEVAHALGTTNIDHPPTNPVDEVGQARGGTTLLHATLYRAQNKAHVEGAFGLFAQETPPLDVRAHSLRDLAREILRLHIQTFARTLNHRPRRDRSWRSRINLHRNTVPTKEEIEAARHALEALRRKLERARANARQRADPLTVRFLDDAFERLLLADPDHHVRDAIAAYGRDVAVEAIAIFEGKLNAGTLPDGARHARYVLGIAQNIVHVHEADAISLALLRDRVALRDAILSPLAAARDQILDDEPRSALRNLLDRALHADRAIDRLFWIDATADLLAVQLDCDILFRSLARRIHATFALTTAERSAIERRLARLVWPLT